MILPGALQVLDSIVAGAINEPARNDPPPSPVPGQAYLVGTAPTGDWLDYPDHIAAFSVAGWRFVAPIVGLCLTEKSTGNLAFFRTGG